MIRNAGRAAGLVLLVAAWSACSEASSRATSTVVDSAGVAVVTNQPGSIEAAEPWSLSAEPVVEIGSGASPEVSLFRVTAVEPLEGGRVAVGTNRPPQGLVFESDGTLAATIGREGEGPGEFASVASVVPLPADSLAVWDPERRRMSVFTGDGRYVRALDLSGLAPLSPAMGPAPSTVSAWTDLLPLSSGTFVLFAVGFSGPGEGVLRVEVPSVRITAGGAERARFEPLPGEETFRSTRTGSMPLTVPVPFGADTHGATMGEAFVVGAADRPRFRVYAPSGALERIVRWPDHDRSIEGRHLSDWTEFVNEWLASMPAGAREITQRLLDQIPQPERFPAYDGLVASDSGEVWVGAYAGQLRMMGTPLNVRVPERRWLVFDVDGALAASVRTPEGFQPYTIRDGRVWGVFQDELDVESVRAYNVLKP